MNMHTNEEMSANHATPVATPLCAVFAPLLPLLDSRELDTEQIASVQEHAATCRWCAARLGQYKVVDDALRHHFGDGASLAMPIALEDITRSNLAESTVHPPPSSAAGPRLVQRGRLPSGPSSLAALAAVLLIAILAALAFSARGRLGAGPTATPTPIPTPTLAPGQDQILLAHTAPWGTLDINGHRVTIPADTQTPITLPLGRDTLVYSAPPFPDVHCTISVPAAADDTCPLSTPAQSATGSPDGPAPTATPAHLATIRVIDAGAVPSRLPTEALNALIAATQRALNRDASSVTVQPGDHYLSGSGGVAVAAQPFTATLSFRLLDQPVELNDQSCDPLCLGPGPQPASGPGMHLVMFPVPVWQYTPPGSKPVTTNETPVNGNAIDMAANWTGSGWQVAVAPTLTASTLLEVPSARLDKLLASNSGWGESGAVVASPSAEGGLIFAGISDTNGWVLYHFGVLVACNAEAHQVFPSLPLAGAHELSIARQLAKQHP